MMRLCMDPVEIEFFEQVAPTQAALQRRYPEQLSASGTVYFRLDQLVLRGRIEPDAAHALVSLPEYADSFIGDPDVAICQSDSGSKQSICIMRETYLSPSLRQHTFHVRQRRTVHSERQSFEVLMEQDQCVVIQRHHFCL